MYKIGRMIAAFLRLLLHVRVEGLDNVPQDSAAILAPNHSSSWEPILMLGLGPKPIYFMAKEEFFHNRVSAWFFDSMNAFPVRRGTPDRKAIRRALSILENRQLLCIFPEGTRLKRPEDGKAHHGASLIALSAKAPIVPVGCIGTGRIIPFGWRRPVIIRFGSAVYYHEMYGDKKTAVVLEETSQDLMNRISNLLSGSAGI